MSAMEASEQVRGHGGGHSWLPTVSMALAECELQSAVVALAQTLRWRVAHFRTGLTQSGNWRTPVAADGKGFPHLVLVRDRVIFAELKSAAGRLSVDQQDWLHALAEAGAERHIWYPSDWTDGRIERVLRQHAIGGGPGKRGGW